MTCNLFKLDNQVVLLTYCLLFLANFLKYSCFKFKLPAGKAHKIK